MKKLILALVACFSLAGCVVEEDTAYARVGTVEVCDNYGCHVVNVQYYGGYPFYYNAAYGVWISPGYGYYHGGSFYHGGYPGYHGYYGHGGYRGGGYHGGGGFHGGHGGHR